MQHKPEPLQATSSEVEEILWQYHCTMCAGHLWIEPDKVIILDHDKAAQAINNLIQAARMDELEKLTPYLVGGAREYHEGDTVSINYEKGYATAQKYLLDRKAILKRKKENHV